jgi:hypothetical protein
MGSRLYSASLHDGRFGLVLMVELIADVMLRAAMNFDILEGRIKALKMYETNVLGAKDRLCQRIRLDVLR